MTGYGRPVRLHDLVDDSFVALYFTDVRRRPVIPADTPGLKHLIVTRRDAPIDSGLRERSLFDVGDKFRQRAGCEPDTVMLVRPDDHIAAIAPMRDGAGRGHLSQDHAQRRRRQPGQGRRMTERIALDIHAHLAPVFPDDLDSVEGVTWKADAKILSVDGHDVGMKPLFDPPALVAWMNQNNVAHAWISIPPPLYRTHLRSDEARHWVRYANRGLQRIADAHPEKLSPLPHLPLQDPEIALDTARDWIARGHRRFGAPSGGHGEQVLSDAAYEPLWRVLERRHAPSCSSIPANARTDG